MMITYMLAALAALPFLPHGKGALILILGGLLLLPASLLWLMAMSGPQRWIAGVELGAVRLGMGPCRIVSANARSCVVVVKACPTCRENRRHKGPCVRERLGLQIAVGARAPAAKVVEISCNRLGRGACTFMIHRGRTP